MFLLYLTKGQILKYLFLPEILPRLHQFFDEGFKSLAVFMALVYRSVKLLPDNHPYIQAGSSGTFTIRDVITAASGELQFSIKHIDQIIIFFTLIAGLILLALQFILLLATLLVGSASAAELPSNYSDIFNTPNPKEDLALRVLDSVFGVPDLFGSKEATGTPYHDALQSLFQLYSVGLLVVAGIILAYFVFVVLAETAQTGTPFGKRYNHVWAPIRLVAGIALLIPISSGFNSAQWITLYAAKFGSGFATVGWNTFNDAVQDQFIDREETIATPNIPSLKDISAFMMITHACKEAYTLLSPAIGSEIDGWIIDTAGVKTAIPLSSAGFQTAHSQSNKKDIYIRFGVRNAEYKDKFSGVFPHCGEIVITNSSSFKKSAGKDGDITLKGIGIIEARYFIAVKEMWNATGAAHTKMAEAAQKMMGTRLKNKGSDLENGAFTPPRSLQDEIEAAAVQSVEKLIPNALKQIQSELFKDQEYKQYGWGGAGIWYNRIANTNGEVTNAVINKPQVKKYPDLMRYTCEEKRQQDKSVNANNCFDPSLSKSEKTEYATDTDRAIAVALNTVFDYWYKDPDGNTGNIFIDTINAILGTEGVFNMCKNADIHPIAQLSTAGKGLIETAIRNIGFSIGGGLASIIPYIGPVASAAGGLFGSVASIGLLIGFILYYMVPLLPFLYFFFAVGTWVRGIFEAMVGVPLWALAHIRIDGEGLPGEAATSGYFLLFEVFIRPILILFGLLASVTIFAAMIKVLNEVFYLAASNLSGFDGTAATSCGANAPTDGGNSAPVGSAEYFRGPVDQFFFTVLYAIIVYLTAMSCFKLIDTIPNQILRWMGSGDKTFSDDAGQTAEGVLTKVAVGGSLLGGNLSGIASGAGGAASGTAQGIADVAQKAGGGSQNP